jgi:hypothetical protein
MATDDGLSNGDILKALGLKLPNTQANPLRDLWNDLADSTDYATFSDDVQGLSSYSEFETYLQDTHGFSAGEASTFREQLESKYASFTDFQDSLSTFDSYEEWENSLSWGETVGGESTDEDGRLVSGFRFHDESGVTREGVRVPAGTVEIFGEEIHTSNTSPPVEEESSGSLFSWANESYSPDVPTPYDPVTISADVTNNGSYAEPFVAALKVDGPVVDESDLVKIGPGNTRTFEFTYRFDEVGNYDVQISSSATQTIPVAPEGLIR